MKLYEVLTQYRKIKKITFDELVARTKIPKSTLQKVFTGVTANPAFDMVQTIADALEVSVNDIAAATRESSTSTIISPAALDVARHFDTLSESSQRLISAIVLFESADVRVKNQIISILVDHANEKLMNSSPFDAASEKLRAQLEAEPLSESSDTKAE